MSGTWGDTVNNGITSLIETSLAGYTSIAMTDANYTLSQANGAADEARSMMVNMTGTLTANRNVVCPNVNKMYVFRNNTTGGFSLVLKTSGGTGVTVPAGKTTTVFCDGADNIFDATSYFSGAITVNGAFTSGSATTTGVFSAPLGSVGAPSYTFTGDTNTGTWSPGADTLAWSTGGSERMRIDSSGNVGIGVTPSVKFEVAGGANVAAIRSASEAGSALLYTVNLNASATQWYVGHNGADVDTGNLRSGALKLFTNSAERMRIDSSGQVGIGGSPSTKVDINVAGGMLRIGSGAGNNQLQAYSSGGTLGLWAGGSSQVYSNGGMAFLVGATTGTGVPSGGTTAVTLDVSGNVGIGKSPSYRLDVSGGAHAQAFTANGTADVYEAAGGTVTYYNGAGDGVLRSYANSSGTGNSTLAFWTAGAERMRIDATGNVGIGVAPNAWGSGFRAIQLQTYGSIYDGNTGAVGMYANVYYDGANLKYRTTNAGLIYEQNISSAAHTWHTVPSGTAGATATATERMRIDSSGNVGIGVAPVYELHVRGASQTTAALTDAGNKGGSLYLQDTGGAPGNGGALFFGTTLGNATPFAAIKGLVSDGATNTIGALAFSTRNAVGDTSLTERMRIDVSGNVGIGGTPTTKLDVFNSNIRMTDGFSLVWGDSSTYISGNASTDIITVTTNSVERMRITSAGVIQDGAGLELGYKDIPRTTGGLTRGQAYATAAGFTVNTGSAAGSAYSVYNDSAAAFTITQGAGLTLRQGGTTNTGNRTLAARGFATIWFNSTTEAVISGSGLT